MHRNARQSAILEIIARKEVETQEELCYELTKLNFNVTQATISRDIKDLKLYKVTGTVKKYKYAYIEGEGDIVTNKMRNLFRECVHSINYANNIIIIQMLLLGMTVMKFTSVENAVLQFILLLTRRF